MLAQLLKRTRLAIAIMVLVLFNVAPVGNAQCPPNHWYCPEYPANCILVGCEKTCADCTYTCAFSRGRDCPPLIMCLNC